MTSNSSKERTIRLEQPRGSGRELIEAVQWRGDNVIEVSAFGGMLRISPDGTLEFYDDQEFVDVPVGYWIVRYQGDHTEHWLMGSERFRGIYG